MSIRVVGVSALPGRVFAAPVKARPVKRRTVVVKTGCVVFLSPQLNSGNLQVGGEYRARYAGERRGDVCQCATASSQMNAVSQMNADEIGGPDWSCGPVQYV